MSIKKIRANSLLLISGLLIFYLLQFTGAKPLIFIAYLITALCFYSAGIKTAKSIAFILILSVFSDSGLGASLFKMEPAMFNPDPGWWFSPMTVSSFLLFLASFNVNYKRIKVNAYDLLVALFMVWNAFLIVIYPFSENVLYGIITVGEMSLVYFLLRINLETEDLDIIIKLLISVILFQSVIGIGQFLLGRNIGSGIESANEIYRYGLTTSENDSLFRITGSYGHANSLAVLMTALIPFSLLSGKNRLLIALVSLSATILTLSRTAWFAAVATVPFMYAKLIDLKARGGNRIFVYGLPILLIAGVFLPIIVSRTATLPDAFREGGSWEVRIRVWEAAVSVLSQLPITGTGHNRFLESAFELTDRNELTYLPNLYAAKVHNLFLEIAVQTGFPGLTIFMACVIYQLIFLFSRLRFGGNENHVRVLLLSLCGLLFMSLFQPVFLTSLFRLFFLLPVLVFI